MQDPKSGAVYEFFKANKMYYSYLLISHVCLIFGTLIYWMLTYQINQGDHIYWVFCVEYLILYLPIIPLSINISRKTNKMNQNLNIKDVKQYGKHQFLSNLFISGCAIYIFTRSILVPFTSDEYWLIMNPLYPLKQNYNPFSSDLYLFSMDFFTVFLNICISVMNTTPPFGPGLLWVLVFFIIGLIMNIQGYIRLRRILLRFVRDKTDQIQILNLFKKMYLYLILFFVSILISRIWMGNGSGWYYEPGVLLTNSKGLFSSFGGVTTFYFLMLYVIISIFKKMRKIALNPNITTILSPKLYKLEKDVKFSERALFFEPAYIVNHLKESKGLSPVIGIIVAIVGSFFALIFLTSLASFLYSGNEEYSFWIRFNFNFSSISIIVVLIGLFLPLRYFQLERTSTEMIFQKGYKKDHIPLNQLQEIALDYEFMKSNELIIGSSVRLRVSIALLIPYHTVCITKDIKMVYDKNNQASFETQLLKVLTKTLFILGYTPQQ